MGASSGYCHGKNCPDKAMSSQAVALSLRDGDMARVAVIRSEPREGRDEI